MLITNAGVATNTGPSDSQSPSKHTMTRLASTIRVTLGFSSSGPPICSAAGPQSFASSDSMLGRSTGMPWPSRNSAIVPATP